MTDAGSVDLTPRPITPGRSRPKWLPLAVVVAVMVAVAGLVFFLITNSQAFLEADVAVEERESQGERRFQLLGSPIQSKDEVTAATVATGDEALSPFTVAFDGVKVDVLSQQIPPQLFQCGVPVVLEGQWVKGAAPRGVEWPVGANDGWYFHTDRILVKHDNDYTEERLIDAEERGQLLIEAVEASDEASCQV
jgi:cytochrome c-type biogenesis protein CcmE